MIVLGVILLVVGWLTGISIVTWLGVLLLILGVVFFALGAAGRPVGGRTWY